MASEACIALIRLSLRNFGFEFMLLLTDIEPTNSLISAMRLIILSVIVYGGTYPSSFILYVPASLKLYLYYIIPYKYKDIKKEEAQSAANGYSDLSHPLTDT